MEKIKEDNSSVQKSSKMVANFLEKTKLHKKDFAQMIGVTLSYVYNLIDENVPFSSRTITLERIAVVMDINPEDFVQYQIPTDIAPYSENLLLLKDLIKHNKLTTLEFLKMFEGKKRLELVDILRGAKPIQIDYAELKKIAQNLNMSNEELFEMWKTRMIEYLKEGGFNMKNNASFIEKIFECAKNYITNS
ncbi:hypothetical protein IJ670_01560 [bacterium]|nr:hypothetical protein [bacterium]